MFCGSIFLLEMNILFVLFLPLTSSGVLYYALTHAPEPLSDEEEFTLSWQAATKRLEAAGSIPVEEARLMAEALQSKEAGIEVRRGGILLFWWMDLAHLAFRYPYRT